MALRRVDPRGRDVHGRGAPEQLRQSALPEAGRPVRRGAPPRRRRGLDAGPHARAVGRPVLARSARRSRSAAAGRGSEVLRPRPGRGDGGPAGRRGARGRPRLRPERPARGRALGARSHRLDGDPLPAWDGKLLRAMVLATERDRYVVARFEAASTLARIDVAEAGATAVPLSLPSTKPVTDASLATADGSLWILLGEGDGVELFRRNKEGVYTRATFPKRARALAHRDGRCERRRGVPRGLDVQCALRDPVVSSRQALLSLGGAGRGRSRRGRPPPRRLRTAGRRTPGPRAQRRPRSPRAARRRS